MKMIYQFVAQINYSLDQAMSLKLSTISQKKKKKKKKKKEKERKKEKAFCIQYTQLNDLVQ
jgi:hypothetical protein